MRVNWERVILAVLAAAMFIGLISTVFYYLMT